MDAVDVEAPVLAVTFTLSVGDYVRGFVFHFGRVISGFSSAVGGFGVLMLLTALSAHSESPPSLAPGFAFIAMGSALPLLIAFAAVIQFLERRDSSDTWSWFQDRIQCATVTLTGTMPWTAFARVRESQSAFLFYPQHGTFRLVPKRALGGAGVETLRRLVVEKLGQHAIVRHEISPGQRAWTRTLRGTGLGIVLCWLGTVIQYRNGTYIPGAVSSAPVGLLDMQLGLLAAVFIWPLLAGFAGSARWRMLGLGLVGLHTVTAVWFVTGSSIADWDLFHRAMDAAPVRVTVWATLYVLGLVSLWVTVLRRR